MSATPELDADAIVIGGGPAGSTAATKLAQAGHVRRGEQGDVLALPRRQGDQFRVRRVPQPVPFEAEIFEAETAESPRHHFGGPRSEILHTADVHVPVFHELLRSGEGETILSVGSGRYEFSGQMARG